MIRVGGPSIRDPFVLQTRIASTNIRPGTAWRAKLLGSCRTFSITRKTATSPCPTYFRVNKIGGDSRAPCIRYPRVCRCHCMLFIISGHYQTTYTRVLYKILPVFVVVESQSNFSLWYLQNFTPKQNIFSAASAFLGSFWLSVTFISRSMNANFTPSHVYTNLNLNYVAFSRTRQHRHHCSVEVRIFARFPNGT